MPVTPDHRLGKPITITMTETSGDIPHVETADARIWFANAPQNELITLARTKDNGQYVPADEVYRYLVENRSRGARNMAQHLERTAAPVLVTVVNADDAMTWMRNYRSDHWVEIVTNEILDQIGEDNGALDDLIIENVHAGMDDRISMFDEDYHDPSADIIEEGLRGKVKYLLAGGKDPQAILTLLGQEQPQPF